MVDGGEYVLPVTPVYWIFGVSRNYSFMQNEQKPRIQLKMNFNFMNLLVSIHALNVDTSITDFINDSSDATGQYHFVTESTVLTCL